MNWEAKKTANEEAKDLTTLRLDQLMGSLLSYEEEKRSSVPQTTKSIAFKSSASTDDESDDIEAETDEELSLLVKGLNKLLYKKRFKRSVKPKSSNLEDKKGPVCYECKKLGHRRNECPLLADRSKSSRNRRRALLAWSDEEDNESESEEEQKANLCYMTRSKSESDSDEEVHLKTKARKDEWYLDSGCSRHMTGDPSKFSKGCSGSTDGSVCFVAERRKNVYIVSQDNLLSSEKCLVSYKDETNLWHRKLGHINFQLLSKIAKKKLVRGLLKLSFEENSFCEACSLGKQTKASFKSKGYVSTSKPLELLHMDLFGPTKTQSLGLRRYAMVVVDDYSRYSRVRFLAHKSDAFG
ncbi:hypothetical protein MLD38_005206 [Melastoma candidum]|uniref:Uncharacterized protein n=1 Tax=Melastoma candidum TaxID=119954 RepID=A0ACB9S9P3_9MYRT|nr:hypothetical protein MLD38_005206 [Melastoma candidum]